MAMDEVLAMSGSERDRLRVVEAVRERRLKQSEAAARLGVSVRQVKRLVRCHREDGAAGLVSKRRGKRSQRRIGEAEREAVLDCVRRRYRDFGPTLAAEYLSSYHGYRRSVETLRQWMIADGLWVAKRARRQRPFQLRERRSALGELVQIDGSPHAWLEERGPRCTLIAFIDDATGRLQYARFEPTETSRAYLQGLRSYVLEHGRPVAFYSDRHSIFTKHDPEDPTPTQFERAVRALGIEPILALSPQAKGRVERAFQTLQDRLVKALRLADVATMEAANALLPRFIDHYNARFGRTPRVADDAHRPLHCDADSLRWTTAEQYARTLSKSLSCQYRGHLYLIQTGGAPAYALHGARLTVCDEGADAPVVLLHHDKPLPYRVFARTDQPPRIADDKTINTLVEVAKRRQAASTYKPPPDHPWKRHTFKPAAAPAEAARSGGLSRRL
jgi:transposase